jgi:uncharacterized protein with HEPN domain
MFNENYSKSKEKTENISKEFRQLYPKMTFKNVNKIQKKIFMK